LLNFYFVYFIDVAEVTNVPTDIRYFDKRFLLNKEAEVLFLTAVNF